VDDEMIERQDHDSGIRHIADRLFAVMLSLSSASASVSSICLVRHVLELFILAS